MLTLSEKKGEELWSLWWATMHVIIVETLSILYDSVRAETQLQYIISGMFDEISSKTPLPLSIGSFRCNYEYDYEYEF